MLAIPENVLARINEVLKQRAVHETAHVYYRTKCPAAAKDFI
jgi:hypothetical protein